MDRINIVREIKRRKYALFASAVVVFALAVWMQFRALNKFTSTARFIVNESEVINLDVPNEFRTEVSQMSFPGMNRMHIFVYSTECLESTIREFGLYRHYNINTDKKFATERAIAKLSKNISLKNKHMNVMELTVKDNDRLVAAKMANFLVSKLNKMNENYLKRQLKRKIVIYNMLYLDIKNEMEVHKQNFAELLKNYDNIIRELSRQNIDVDDLKASLQSLAESLRGKEQEIIKIRQLYTLIMNTIDNEKLETITLVNKALPDYRSPALKIAGISGLISIVFFSTCCFVMWVYYENREFWKAVLSGGDDSAL